MGNFNLLAEQVLNKKRGHVVKVSSFPSLANETGNFQWDGRNNRGNLNKIEIDERPYGLGFHMETGKATNKKPAAIIEETFKPEYTIQRFLNGTNTPSILNIFIDGAEQFGIKLIHDDKKWLKTICYKVQSFRLKMILEEYINYWIEAMYQEPIQYKKQNAGRFAANTFMREAFELVKNNQ